MADLRKFLSTLLLFGNTCKPLSLDVVLLRMKAARFKEVRRRNGMNPQRDLTAVFTLRSNTKVT